MLVIVPDQLAKVYLDYAHETGRSINGIISAQLERFKDLSPGLPAIVVSRPDAEAILGGLPIADGPALLDRVKQLASIQFGPIKLDFNPAQLKELQWRAERSGRTPEYLAKEIADQILKDFFWVSGGGPAKPPQQQPVGKSVPASTGGV